MNGLLRTGVASSSSSGVGVSTVQHHEGIVVDGANALGFALRDADDPMAGDDADLDLSQVDGGVDLVDDCAITDVEQDANVRFLA